MFEESAGIIPIHKTTKDILLVHHLAGHWGFPKGHIENNETQIEAALRELIEETNIKEVELKGKPIVKQYSFEKNGIKTIKKVTYFPGIVSTKDVSIKKDELQDFGWFPYTDAFDRLTFSKEVLADLDMTQF